jgi:hypothetical protein
MLPTTDVAAKALLQRPTRRHLLALPGRTEMVIRLIAVPYIERATGARSNTKGVEVCYQRRVTQ